MCEAGRVAAGDVVFEIGPGSGVLTKELLARGARVVGLEADPRAIEVLEKQFTDEISSGNFVLHHGDARQLTLSSLGLEAGHYKAVANIPYYLSGQLFRTMLDTNCQPTDLVFLVQKEVAERIARDPKESLLSLSVKVFGTPTYVRTVSAGHFTPKPAVDSAIVAIHNISTAHFTDCDREFFFDVLHLGFGQKRKQLLGNLSKRFDRAMLTHSFSTVGLPTDVRAEDVVLEQWLALTKEIVLHGSST